MANCEHLDFDSMYYDVVEAIERSVPQGDLNDKLKQQFKNHYEEYLSGLSEDNFTSVLNDIASAYSDAINLYYNINAYSVENLKTSLNNAFKAIKDNRDFKFTTSNSLNTSRLERVTTNLDIKADIYEFLDKYYAGAVDARMYAHRWFNSLIVSKCLIDTSNNEVIANSEQLNNSIIGLIQDLYNNIKESVKGIVKEDLKIFDDKSNFNQEAWQKIISEYYKKTDAAFLQDAFSDFANGNDTQREEAEKKLKIYNSWVLLANLDSYLKYTLGDNIVIKNFGSFQGLSTENQKYSFAEKGVDNNENWRTTDNVYADNEISGIVKLLIESVPLLDGNGLNTGNTIKFQYFSYIMSKINNLGNNRKLDDSIIFNGYYNFSKSTNTILNNIPTPTVSKLINLARYSPNKYYPAIFEILAKSKINDSYLDRFDKQLIKSLYNGVFSLDEGAQSIISTVYQKLDSNKDINYLTYITYVCNTIHTIQYLQYYTDENGDIRSRTLQDGALDDIKRFIENTIINQLCYKNGAYINSILKKYPDLITFDSDDKSIKLFGKIFEYNSADKYWKGKGQISDENTQDIKKFIKDVLNIDLINNTKLEQYLKSRNSTYLNEQFNFAANVFINAKLSYDGIKSEILDKQLSINKTILQSGITEGFKNYVKDINYTDIGFGFTSQGLVKLIPNNFINTLYEVSNAYAFLDGASTSTIIHNAEGNGLPISTLSRLSSCLGVQFDNLNKKFDSAVKDSLFFKAFKGIYTAQEIKLRNGKVKHSTKFSTSEMFIANFIYDFIGKIYEDQPILLISSINSDKKTIPRMGIDLNTKVEINGTDKPLKDLNQGEWRELISQELGNIYTNQVVAIQKDWANLISFVNEVFDPQPNSASAYTDQDLLRFLEAIGINTDINSISSIKEAFSKMDARMWANDFEEFNNLFGEKSYDVLMGLVQAYNQFTTYDHLNFIDQIHYVNTRGKLSFNESIRNTLYRFNKKYLQEIDSTLYKGELLKDKYNNRMDSDTFWDFQKKEILKDLILNNIKIPLDKKSSVFEKMKERYYNQDEKKNWVSKQNELIYAKLIINGYQYSIANQEDIYSILDAVWGINELNAENLNNLFNNPNVSIVLNPLIEKYNYIDYLFSEEYLINTVGSHVAHTSKNKENVNFDEVSRKKAQHKRNVSQTATVKEFALDLVNGIPLEYNIAIIRDIKDTQYNIMGDIDDGVKPYDGATFVNPFMVILENNSLGPDKAGLTKKQFVHFYNERFATGGIIKTAGFAITNDTIRNSIRTKNLAMKMTNIPWKKNVDITKDYRGRDINISNDTYYKRGGNYYQLKSIKKLENGDYNIIEQEVDEYGVLINVNEISRNISIKSNWDLWQVLGGEWSMELKNGKLVPSEHSIHQMINYINNVTIEGYTLDHEPKYASELEQPLKAANIHYLCTEGSVKQGAANINSNAYYDNELPFNFMKIKMLQGGIQLDKEHHADESELSLMTQVMSACSARGYSLPEAAELYKSLATLSKIRTKEITEAIASTFTSMQHEEKETVKANIRGIVNKLIIKNLSSKGVQDSDFATILAKDLIEEFRAGKSIDWKNSSLPISDNSIYGKMVSIISTTFTNSGIKIKIPGILSVLTPSKGMFLLYGDRKLESFNTEEEILELQKSYDENPIISKSEGIIKGHFSNLEMGRKYKVVVGEEHEIITLSTPIDYYDFVKKYKNIEQDFTISEYIVEGRDLGSYNVRFEGKLNDTVEDRFQLYDLDSVRNLFIFKEYLSGKITTDNLPSIILQAIDKFKQDSKQIELFLRRELQRDLDVLSNSSTNVNQEANNSVRINGNEVKVIKSSIEISACEVAMPKTFIKEFGLDTFDDLYSIKNNKNFFTIKLLERLKNKAEIESEDYYDIQLHTPHKNIYVISKDRYERQVKGKLDLKPIEQKYDEDGDVFRMDNEEVLYQLSSGEDFVVTDSNGIEVIVSDNLSHYINTIPNFNISISTNDQVEQDLKTPDSIIYKQLFNSNYRNKYFHKNKKNQWEILGTDKIASRNIATTEDVIARLKSRGSSLDGLLLSKELENVIKQGKEMHTSFLRSLDIVAARIPAQSMQSFMPMKVVAFDNPNINNAYVSVTQIWLQGSDYDIDSVSLATFAVDKTGKLPLWSPYADLTSLQSLEQSFKLPFPTGETIELTEYQDEKARENIQDVISTLLEFEYLNENLRFNTKPIAVDFLLRIYSKYKLYKNCPDIEINGNIIKGEDIDTLFRYFQKVINNHNTYLNDIPKNKVDMIMQNRIQYYLHRIASNPANMIQAQTPLDAATKPLKEIADNSSDSKLSASEIPGNVMTKFKDIERVQNGATGIGITAVGLKSLFAINYYQDYVMTNGTEEDQQLLPFKDLDGNQKLIPNIYTADKNSIKDDTLKELYKNEQNNSDSAVTLAALTSLAVDNAKELKLDALNATDRTLGIYIYAITTGMSFNEVANLMQSETGKCIIEAFKSNEFLNERGIYSILSFYQQMILGPDTSLERFKKSELDSVKNKISEKLNSQDNTLSITQLLENYAKTQYNKNRNSYQYSYINLIKILKDLKANHGYASTVQNNTNIFNIYDILIQHLRYKARVNMVDLNKIVRLSMGAEEMKVLGQILGLNQGIPSTAEKLKQKINTIETLISRRAKELNSFQGLINPKSEKIKASENRLDIGQLIYNEDYRKDKIQEYENIKHSFNIIDLIFKVPQYKEYVTLLYNTYKSLYESSARFRFESGKAIDVLDNYEIKSSYGKQKGDKKLSKYGTEYMINAFLLGNQIEIECKGLNTYFINGKEQNAKNTPKIYLGTKDANATFKKWMDTVVFPKIKQENPYIFSLQDLVPSLFTNNISEESSINYALPINQLPKSDAERSIYIKYNNNFSQISNIGIDSYTLTDLIFYYNLISYQNSVNKLSFTKMLQQFTNVSIVKDYYDFCKEFDKSQDIFLNEEDSSILPYIATLQNPYAATDKYILVKDRNSFSNKLAKLKEKQSSRQSFDFDAYDTYDDQDFDAYDLEDGEYQIKSVLDGTKYEFMEYQQLDTNFYVSGTSANSNPQYSLNFEYNGEEYTANIFGNSLRIDINGEIIETNNSTIPYTNLSIKDLESIIDNNKNQCNL